MKAVALAFLPTLLTFGERAMKITAQITRNNASISQALAQTSQICYSSGRCLEGFVDSVSGVQLGFALPPPGDTLHPNELIGQIDAPIGVKWAGIPLGGMHNLDPLIVAWPYNWNTIKFSTRQASNYAMPTVYLGPTITTIETTFTATRWQWTFRCQNCLSWTNVGPGGDGSINTSGYTIFALAWSTTAALDPSDANSDIEVHTDFRLYGQNMAAASTADYSLYLLP